MNSRLFIAPLILAMTACSSNLELQMLNASGLTIHNVVVEYSGTRVDIDKIHNQKLVTLVLRPHSESDIQLRYSIEKAEPVICDLNTYVEPGYRGKITVNLLKDKCDVSEVDLTVF